MELVLSPTERCALVSAEVAHGDSSEATEGAEPAKLGTGDIVDVE
jgi:hypothetical protein